MKKCVFINITTVVSQYRLFPFKDIGKKKDVTTVPVLELSEMVVAI